MMSDNEEFRRLPAEWERHGGVILAWPHSETDWEPILDEVTDCYENIVRAIAAEEVPIIIAPDTSVPKSRLSDLDNILYITLPTNDTWARDFGPITIFESGCPVV